MAVTKRTRFEVLRRDNHACRYCGAAAPEVALVVDHVVPVALGGSDSPDNLVACCIPCNTGKASTAPDSDLVADVAEDALRHAELMRQAYTLLVERLGEREEYVETFADAYPYVGPDDWRVSVGRWFNIGVPIEVVLDAVETACAAPHKFRGTGRFSYMAAIVWKQARLVDEIAEAKRYLDGRFLSEPELTDLSQDWWTRGYHCGIDGERRRQETAQHA